MRASFAVAVVVLLYSTPSFAVAFVELLGKPKESCYTLDVDEKNPGL